MKYDAIIVAAGSGSRSGLKYNKVLYKIDNKTIIEKSAENFLLDDECENIFIVINMADLDKFKDLNFNDKVIFVEGGATRFESVHNSIKHLKNDYVMIHDGARPYLNFDKLALIKQELENFDACLLMVKSIDTSKIVINNEVQETLNRSIVYNAQTPQAFKTSTIKAAYAKAIFSSEVLTDDAQVVEKFAETVIRVIEGDYSNIKYTNNEDFK